MIWQSEGQFRIAVPPKSGEFFRGTFFTNQRLNVINWKCLVIWGGKTDQKYCTHKIWNMPPYCENKIKINNMWGGGLLGNYALCMNCRRSNEYWM